MFAGVRNDDVSLLIRLSDSANLPCRIMKAIQRTPLKTTGQARLPVYQLKLSEGREGQLLRKYLPLRHKGTKNSASCL